MTVEHINSPTKYKATCKHCGSEDLLFDAYVVWVKSAQIYSIANVMDKPVVCNKCNGETTVNWDVII